MIRYIVILLLIMVGVNAKAQFPSQQNPTQFSTGWFKQGWQQADSGHILAVRSPNFTPRFPGATIMYQNNGVDTSVHYWTGQRWIKVNTKVIDTTSLSNRINLKLNITDTTNKWWGVGKRFVDSVFRVNDSTIGVAILGGTYTFEIKGGASGGGGGISSLAPIGSAPNANGATITGSALNLEPTNGTYGGVLNTDTQTIRGSKAFISKHNTIQGFAARLNSQWIPTSKQPDSLYESGKYLGFGFIDMFASGVYVMVYNKADNHVGDNGVIMLGKSYDQGKTWISDTIVSGGTGYDVTMGGGGVSQSNRLIVFFQRLDNTTQNGIDLRTMYSDDEGQTWSTQSTQSSEGNTSYQMYGGLVKIGGDSLLLSWYGINGSTYSSYVIKSGDDGVTWSSPITVFSNTTSQRTESSFTYVGGQTILGLMRSEVNDTLYGQVISVDNGNTWAYQGQVSWGVKGTPAWLKTFQGANGKKVVVAYYRSGVLGDFEERAIYGYADSLILGPSKWDLTTEVVLGDNLDGSGYLTVAHPYDQMYGIGYYYDETIPQEDATIKFITVPYGTNIPIGSASGLSGLTAPRIPVASGAASLTDYNSLSYNSSAKSLLINNVTPLAWAGHNGGIIEGGKANIVLSQDNYAAILQNAYIDTDYKGVGTGGASALIQDAGNIYLMNTNSTSAGSNITWNQRLKIESTGGWIVNGTPGTLDQVFSSNGAGTSPTWKTFISSQWVNGSGADIYYNVSNGEVGIGTSSPTSPLHVNANTSGVSGYTAKFIDANSSIGMSMIVGWTGGGTNEKYKSIFIDGAGWNFGTVPDALNAAPTSQMTLDNSGELGIGTTTPAFRLDVNGKAAVRTMDSTGSPANMVWQNPVTKELMLAAVPTAGGITTLNTLTAVTQTFATGTSGTDFNISSSTSTHTFNIPDASVSNRGVVTTGTQTFTGAKTFATGITVVGSSGYTGTKLVVNGDISNSIDPGVAGVGLSVLSSFTYTNTDAAGTVAGNQNINLFGTPTFTSSNAISYTGNVASVRFSGAPIAAGSTTISHPYNILANDVNYLAGVAMSLNEQSGDITIANASGVNVYTGAGGNTWTLPSLVVHPGKFLFIKNAGAGNLTVQRAGSDNIYNTSSVTSITVAAGADVVLAAGSSFWYVLGF